jgi:imidazole glycerol phosphate synthase subunit HisF
VVLDADVAAGVGVVLDVGDRDSVDFDIDAIAAAGDLVTVPIIAFEGSGDLGLFHVFL